MPNKSDWLFVNLLLLNGFSVFCIEKFQVVGPDVPVVVFPGEDTVLPCYLSPNISTMDLEIRWFKKNFASPVILFKNKRYNRDLQDEFYRGRAELFPDELLHGNVSLKLRDVKHSDHGQYTCLVESTEHYEDTQINLGVRALGSQPSVSLHTPGGDQTQLLCRSEGWYPEPAVIWIDRDGNDVTSLSKTTVEKDSQEFLNVSSYIPVKQESNVFSCMIISVLPEPDWGSQLHIPRDFFPGPSGWMVSLFLIVTITVAASTLLVIQWRRMDKEETMYILKVNPLLHRELEAVKSFAVPKSQWQWLCSAAAELTLDPDTAFCYLSLSEDRRKMRWKVLPHVLPDNPQRFDSLSCVLSRESFTLGRYYWEVELNDQWRIGVTRDSAERKGGLTFSPEKGYWVLECDSSHLTVLPRRVGVYLDIEERKVSFYSVDSRTHIFTFTDMVFNQGEKIYPFFWTIDEYKDLVVLPPVSCEDQSHITDS
nr:PREDICTED: butyrophilin subfamily 1 member A1-like [Lepisosteus oculatus]XP_015217104.1 PREDICTED: butyrophilin subfamily 1 member A1-like [Lepisosteus oculatus]